MADQQLVAANATANRWMSDREGERINVKDYGAVGDGTTDDTAAIQAAFDKVHVLGGKKRVYVPGGTYLVGALSIKPSSGNFWGFEIAGDGENVSVFRLKSGASPSVILRYESPSVLVSEITIRDLGFRSVSADSNSGTAIKLFGASGSARIANIRIEDCQFFRFSEALSLKLCANLWIDQLNINKCDTGIKIDTCADVKLTNCYVNDGAGWAYDVSGEAEPTAASEGVYMMDCKSDAMTGGLRVQNQRWGEAIGCSFLRCKSSASAIVFANVWAWRVAQCEIAAAPPFPGSPTSTQGVGLLMDANCERCIVVGNFLALNNIGVSVRGKDHTIADNILDAGLWSGADIEINGATYSMIRGNKCMSVSNSSTYSITEISTANYNYITNNMVKKAINKIGANSVSSADQFGPY